MNVYIFLSLYIVSVCVFLAIAWKGANLMYEHDNAKYKRGKILYWAGLGAVLIETVLMILILSSSQQTSVGVTSVHVLGTSLVNFSNAEPTDLRKSLLWILLFLGLAGGMTVSLLIEFLLQKLSLGLVRRIVVFFLILALLMVAFGIWIITNQNLQPSPLSFESAQMRSIDRGQLAYTSFVLEEPKCINCDDMVGERVFFAVLIGLPLVILVGAILLYFLTEKTKNDDDGHSDLL